jgi:hypothetical protein
MGWTITFCTLALGLYALAPVAMVATEVVDLIKSWSNMPTFQLRRLFFDFALNVDYLLQPEPVESKASSVNQ